MASAWGNSFGLAFGVAFGAIVVTPPVVVEGSARSAEYAETVTMATHDIESTSERLATITASTQLEMLTEATHTLEASASKLVSKYSADKPRRV